MKLNSTATRSLLLLSAGLAAGLLVGVGMLIGSLVTQAASPQAASPQASIPQTLNGIPLPPEVLQASATHGSENFAISTGVVSENAEGVFVLDYLTGELSCWVLYAKQGTFGAKYTVNIVGDLGVERGKKPQYLMVSGLANFPGARSGIKPANSVIYIVDGNTGNVAAYGIPWNQAFESAGRPQIGRLTLIASGKIRNLEVEE
jgi:hypothetical protein